MSIKPIETHYKGYRFRSRLEARWATFFDALGLSWEYEKEGFDLDGKYYLPDFWLPQARMWAEVKGETFTSEEKALCAALASQTRCCVLMLAGVPDYKPYPFYGADGIEERTSCSPWEEDQQRWMDAVNAARSARFEHGENSAPKPKYSPRFYYDDDDGETGECEDCGRTIKAKYTLCYTCKNAYEAY